MRSALHRVTNQHEGYGEKPEPGQRVHVPFMPRVSCKVHAVSEPEANGWRHPSKLPISKLRLCPPGASIDSSQSQAERCRVKQWLSLLLLFGALLGLLGQEAAFAQGKPVAKAEQVSTAATQMSPECAEMMGLAKPSPQPEKPCQGMTPDCMAKMGCAVPVALIPPLAFDAMPQFRESAPPQMPVARLVGRDTGPEPEPPTRLG